MDQHINENADNLLYQTYRNAGPSMALIVPAVLLNIVVIPGVLMNAFVVFVTIFTKTLHGTANFLLAFISLLEIVHQTGHLIFLVIVVSGINFVTFIQAVSMEMPMLLASNASLFAMVSAAFDRLFIVVAPIKHETINKYVYLAIHLLCCVVYGIYASLETYLYYLYQDTNLPTTGCVSEVLSGRIGGIFFRNTVSLVGLSSLFYFFIWLAIRFMKGVSNETSGRLLKSLVVILAINIGGYIFTLGFYQVLFHLPRGTLDPIRVWHIGFVTGILLNCCSASNALVLYVNSTEYRKAFKFNLHKITKLLKFPVGEANGSWANSTQVRHQVHVRVSTPNMMRSGTD